MNIQFFLCISQNSVYKFKILRNRGKYLWQRIDTLIIDKVNNVIYCNLDHSNENNSTYQEIHNYHDGPCETFHKFNI